MMVGMFFTSLKKLSAERGNSPHARTLTQFTFWPCAVIIIIFLKEMAYCFNIVEDRAVDQMLEG